MAAIHNHEGGTVGGRVIISLLICRDTDLVNGEDKEMWNSLMNWHRWQIEPNTVGAQSFHWKKSSQAAFEHLTAECPEGIFFAINATRHISVCCLINLMLPSILIGGLPPTRYLINALRSLQS